MAQRDFKVVAAGVYIKYARYEGYDPDQEVNEAMKKAQVLALKDCPDEGRARRADWFLKVWAKYLWDFAREYRYFCPTITRCVHITSANLFSFWIGLEGARDFGDDPNERIPGGFGDASRYQSFSSSLAASPEHEAKLEKKRIALDKEDRERAELALTKLMQERAKAKAEAERQDTARQAELQRQRQEEERRLVDLTRSLEMAGVVKIRQQVAVSEKEMQDLTSRTASSHKDAALPLPAVRPVSLLPRQLSPERSGLGLCHDADKNPEGFVANGAPQSGGIKPNWTPEETQEGDQVSKGAAVTETGNLEDEAKAAGFDKYAHAYEAKCLGIQDALAFYKYKAFEQEELKKETLARYFAGYSSVSEGPASGSGPAKSKTWAGHSGDHSEEDLKLSMLQTSAVVDKGKRKAVLSLPVPKKPRTEVDRA